MKILVIMLFILGSFHSFGGGRKSKSKTKKVAAKPSRNYSCAYLYEHAHYKGKRWEFCPGRGNPSGWNDKASSIQVPRGGKVKVCKHANEGGPCHSYFRDVANVGAYMNDQISWVKKGTFNFDDFTMIMISDPQIYWACKTTECESSASGEKAQGELSNDWHVKSINKLVSKIPFDKFGGVIVNGDLTAFGHSHEYDAFIKYYESKNFKHNLYTGLGNHDYGKNNVNDSWQNNCALRMVDYMVNRARSYNPRSLDVVEKSYYKFPSRRHDFTGSLGYTFDIGKFRFVQLHNYPTWQTSFNGWNFGKARRDSVNIKSSMNFVKKELQKDRNKVFIFNWHDAKEYFDGKSRKQFADMCNNNKCPAVFAGHFHNINGKYTDYVGSRKRIPVYLSGSASYNKYLKVRFQKDRITITKINSVSGNVKEYGSYTIRF